MVDVSRTETRRNTSSVSYTASGAKLSSAVTVRVLVFFHTCDALLALYMLWPYVRPSVRLSHISVLSKVSKRLNVGSRKYRRTIAQDCSFMMPMILVKFRLDHLKRGRQMQVGPRNHVLHGSVDPKGEGEIFMGYPWPFKSIGNFRCTSHCSVAAKGTIQ